MYKKVEFQKRKVQRAIIQSGKTITLFRHKKNEFGEPLKEAEQITTINGIYHVGIAYQSVTNSDSGSITNIKTTVPMILCLIDDISNLIQKDDFFTIGNDTLRVNGKIDVENEGYAFDISCEVVEVET